MVDLNKKSMSDSVKSLETVDIGEIDMTALTDELGGDITEGSNDDILAIFPDPLPKEDPSQNFFTAQNNNPSDKKQQQQPKLEKKSIDIKKKKKKKKAKSDKPRLDDDVDNGEEDDGNKNDGGNKNVNRKEELRAKLRQKMIMQHELGGRAKLLNQAGVSMAELERAAKAEASGKHTPQSKQQAMMNKTEGMFGSMFQSMDAKQKAYLKNKTGEVSEMATDLMTKMLNGGNKSSTQYVKKKKKSTTLPEFTSTFDSKLDLSNDPTIENNNNNKNKSATESNKSTPILTPTQVKELPIRPRLGAKSSERGDLTIESISGWRTYQKSEKIKKETREN